jgi:energy-coupling factor transporter ATP-binding protein EcfA2
MMPIDVTNELKLKIPNFELQECQKPAYRRIFDYFNTPQTKGLFLTGEVGTGKSSLMRAYQYLLSSTSKRFSMFTERELATMFFDKNVGLNEVLDNKQINGFGVVSSAPKNICIDDLGVKLGTLNYYGNKINLIEELLIDRYDLMIRYGVLTHATSNIVSDIEKYVDVRTFDRLKEMFIFINLPGRSFRK